TTATAWTVVQRAAEDADRFPAATYNAGAAVSAVLTAGGLTAVVGGAGFARTNAANTFTAAQTVVASGAAVTPLAVKGASGQTANLTEWQSSTGTALMTVTPYAPPWGSATQLTFKMPGAIAQTEMYLRPWDTGGGWCRGLIFAGDSYNEVACTGQYRAANGFLPNITANDVALVSGGLKHTLEAGHCLLYSGGTVFIFGQSAANVPLVSRGKASQTANLQEWQDSSANVLATVSENGYFTTRRTTAPADAELANGELTFWYDEANAKFKIKAKNNSGAVVTGEVALS
ncbi:MAG TPA: hypothetical protein VFG68_01625, partial [Fimbriiglobus sp.]|nr:hypothetical protein [Fimbriiglobus sp.]